MGYKGRKHLLVRIFGILEKTITGTRTNTPKSLFDPDLILAIFVIYNLFNRAAWGRRAVLVFHGVFFFLNRAAVGWAVSCSALGFFFF